MYWAAFNKVANFLKHAVIEHDASIGVDEVDPFILIMEGCEHYHDLMGRHTPEMEVWLTHELYVKRDLTPPKGGPFRHIAEALRSIEPKRRNKACTKLILSLKRHGQRTRDTSE
jgi:hypothetical protein